MDSYGDEHEYGPGHIPMFQKVMDRFEGKPDFQRLVQLGILANMGYDVEYDDAEDYDCWVRSPDRSGVHGYGSSGTRASSSSPQAHSLYHGAVVGNVGASKEEDKAERKRLKRQKRKERKRNEKQKEKKEQSKEEKDEKKAENEKAKAAVKEQVAAKESGGSGESEDDLNDEDSSASEELDLTSTFVSKARSKLEQRPKPEKEKKTPAKEPKSSLEKPKPDAEAEKKPSSQSLEENLRISTQYANLGNTHAEAGNFKVAVEYYTDAIKHNLLNYKLFGNRSLCFERMRLYMKALDDAEVALSMHPGWVKGLFRKGKALAGLKRYEEAERVFRQVVEADGSCADAAHELMRVQIAQLMDYGYTVEQSSHALSAHQSVRKALHFLGSFNHQAASLSTVMDRRSPPGSQSGQPRELFPIWVGNLFGSVTESSLEKLFSKVGPVASVRLLTYKRCAFVNFTKWNDCEEAIRMFNGFDLNGIKMAVRYPDRIPPGMGISRAALTS